LPGVEWCPIHGAALHLAPTAENILAGELTFKKAARLYDLDAAPAFIRRYVMALEWLCTRGSVSARADFGSWVEEESDEPDAMGWKPHPWSKWSLIARNAPAKWFAAQFVHPYGSLKRRAFPTLSPRDYNPALALLAAALTTTEADVAAVIARAQAAPLPRLQ